MTAVPPTVRRPSREEIRDIASRHHMDLTEAEVDLAAASLDRICSTMEHLDGLSESRPERAYTDRDPGERPDRAADPHNAFVRRCLVAGASEGSLAGYDVGLKDNVSVAGVPMTNGSRNFRDYVPNRDATVVRRLLDAGATITGKLNMAAMSLSASGELTASGPILNPANADHLAGGSSGGPAAAVAAGDVDVALGTDQGGSIRLPAAWCGVVGLKPTFGLVPYTGIAGFGGSLDHVGPIAQSVDDCARTLGAVAGDDGRDPRQGRADTQDYVHAVENRPDPADLTVGVVAEGFDREESDERSDDAVREALDDLADAGVTVTDISVPYHEDGRALHTAIVVEELAACWHTEGVGKFAKGHYDTQYAEAFGKARRVHGDDWPPALKVNLVAGEYLSEMYLGHYYAKAQNLVRGLTAAYDAALADVDVLAMPTSPRLAHEHREDVSVADSATRAVNMLGNTTPFNDTGHPALSLPCGTARDLPVGLMLVGNRFDDAALLAASATVETVR